MIGWNRNSSRIYEIDGKKIVSKDHQKPIFLKRELFFYKLFQRNQMIKTPEIYSSSELNLKTYFIETEEKNIFQTAVDWAKIHSYFMKNPIENSCLLIQHNIGEVTSYIFNNMGVFDKLGSIVKDKLSCTKINKEITTILHGDLQKKNMVTFQGNNYYFDFELGGLGHPGRDIASMIISNPRKKNALIDIYRKNIDFDYPKIKEDIDSWLMARTAQLYVIFNKREGNVNQKEAIKKKLSEIIQEL